MKKKPSSEESVRRLELEVLELRGALMDSVVALDDWINTFAEEFCDEKRVKEAHQRIIDNGGTLYYIATIQEVNRNVLKKYEPESGYNCLPDK